MTDAQRSSQLEQQLIDSDNSVTLITRCQKIDLLNELAWLLDAVTPKEWGDLVYNSLTNAISTTIPYGGHGATAQTPCGQDLVVSFVTYPDAPLNTACATALQPKWVLPVTEAAR